MIKGKFPIIAAVTSLSLVLTACGGDDNTSTNNGTGSNPTPNNLTFKYNIFDREYAGSNSDIVNITREEYTFSNGSVTLAIKGLLKPYVASTTNNDYSYEIGQNYLAKRLDNDDLSFVKNVKVTQPSTGFYKVNYQTLGENNQVTNHSITFKEIDISGVFDFALKEKQGLDLWINNFRYRKLPAVVTFPVGSTCFAEMEITQDRVTYGFEESDQTSFTSLDSYLESQSDVIISSIKRVNVGLNNQSQVVEFNRTGNDYKSYAVLYNGKVYQYAYKAELKETQNTDITKGKVNCDPLNTVAANYIEQQLIAAYK